MSTEPTFKLVLVGDGGTGKVSANYLMSRIMFSAP